MTEPVAPLLGLSAPVTVPGTLAATITISGRVPGGGSDDGNLTPGAGPGEMLVRLCWDHGNVEPNGGATWVDHVIPPDGGVVTGGQPSFDMLGAWRIIPGHLYRTPGTYVITAQYLTLESASTPLAVGSVPTSPVLVPAWLAPSDVSDWLTQTGAGTPADLQRVIRVCAAVEPTVQDAREDCWVITPVDPDHAVETRTYVPDAEVYQAAVQLAARVVRRRNSPGGLENYAEAVVYVSRWDPDIQRALRQGPYRRAAVG